MFFSQWLLGSGNSKSILVNNYLVEIAVIEGETNHVIMHVARHTFAYISDQASISLVTLQQLLGHSKMTTAMQYVESLRWSEELDEAIRHLF